MRVTGEVDLDLEDLGSGGHRTLSTRFGRRIGSTSKA
jgi:hypothetical protein